MIQLEFLFIIIISYLLIGLAMVLWDFRNVLFKLHSEHKEDFLEKPLFLTTLTVGIAIVFILLWPYKLLRKKG